MGIAALVLTFCVVGSRRGVGGIAATFEDDAAGDGEGVGVVGVDEAALDGGVDVKVVAVPRVTGVLEWGGVEVENCGRDGDAAEGGKIAG